MLNDAREKAQQIGADAIVWTQTHAQDHRRTRFTTPGTTVVSGVIGNRPWSPLIRTRGAATVWWTAITPS